PNVKKYLPVLLVPLFLAVGCATPKKTASTKKVRTTAYTHTEAGGRKNALGGLLSDSGVHSAAADWSRFPIGTKFQILQTGEICQVDDYGSALVGTNTIDLYKSSRGSMNNWGVRLVDIRILQWGSPSKSLEILSPRAGNWHVRRMITELRVQMQPMPTTFRKVKS